MMHDFSYQWPVTSYQLSVISDQLSVISRLRWSYAVPRWTVSSRLRWSYAAPRWPATSTQYPASSIQYPATSNPQLQHKVVYHWKPTSSTSSRFFWDAGLLFVQFNQKNSSMLCIGVNKIKNHFDTSQLCCGVVHCYELGGIMQAY